MSVIVALVFLAITTTNFSFCNGSSYIGCIESERQALLRFKQDLNDSSNRLASWTTITGDRDCCTWAGVVCHNFTGHVLELHLGHPLCAMRSFDEVNAFQRLKLIGKINPSLLDLKHLIYLDLSCNDFQGIQIPKFLGSMRNLRYLNLTRAGFQGMIPYQLGNLSNLQYLDLQWCSWSWYAHWYPSQDLSVENLHWLSDLSLLKHLDLSGLNLSKASDWMSVTNTLTSLVVLKLSFSQLPDHLPPLSIANFSSLAILDLSENQFLDFFSLSWIFGLSRLVFLDLSYNYFQGPIPIGLQNLTSLRHLDLSWSDFNGSIPSDWWCKFSNLEYLSLDSFDLSGTIPDSIGNLTYLKVLDLGSYYKLEGKIPRSWGSLCNLHSIFLSDVTLRQDMAEILDIFSECVSNKLEVLGLWSGKLYGNLTNQLGKFKRLKALYLHNNSISGPIPSCLSELSSLTYLELALNKLSGPIPLSVGKMSSLEDLDLSYNRLNGSLLPVHFVDLTRMTSFDVSGNSLMMKIPPNWVPPFQLRELSLQSCHLGPRFPLWVLSQKYLSSLDISNSGISDTIPIGFWKFLPRFSFLNLSHNRIYGEIPNLTKAIQLMSLDLSSNNFSGQLPRVPFSMNGLHLSNNAFSGSIFHFLCYEMNESVDIRILDLENNFLSGELPYCWRNLTSLVVLNLNNNKFMGTLPTSMGTLSSLRSLHLRKNSFSGAIPMSIKSCTQLIALDIGENEFAGNVPTRIGERFSRLMFLSLRSNKFHGHIPTEICHLNSLRLLDLAHNNLSGSIPRCINNFSDMAIVNKIQDNGVSYYTNQSSFTEDAILVMKGKVAEYNTILNLVRSIDFSKNKLSGVIPVEMIDLKALQSLNLSQNNFTGTIPESIGDMRPLESIDFSMNQLSSEIPHSIATLTFINHLNFSNNKLTGKIPLSTQLQSLDATSFIGNELCGPPLQNNCTMSTPILEVEKNGVKNEVDWFYVSMTLGFMVGFWSVIGPLIANRRWRHKYCHFLDRLGEKFGCVV